MAIDAGRTSAWGARLSKAFAEILGLDIGEGTPDELRDAARTAGRQLPDEVVDQECSLCFAGTEIPGRSRMHGATFEFFCDERVPATPVGSEVRLKCRQGSLRCLVLGTGENRLWLARAPNRCERRRHPRHAVEGVAVVCFSDDREAEAAVKDISEGGAGIVSGCLLEVGEPVKLFLQIAGLKRITFEVDGWVANCKPGGRGQYCIGVQFRELPEDVREELRRMRAPTRSE